MDNNMNNNPFDDWGIPEGERSNLVNNNSSINMNNQTNAPSTNINENNNTVVSTIENVKPIENNVQTPQVFINDNNDNKESLIKRIISYFFLSLGIYIAPWLLLLGIFAFFIFGSFSDYDIDLLIIMILLFFVFPIVIIILYIKRKVNYVRNDISQNGFSIWGNTPFQKIKSGFILLILLYFLFRLLSYTVFNK